LCPSGRLSRFSLCRWGSPFNQRWALCYAKRPQKPIDHDLYVGQRPRHDRTGAYRHPTNESVPLAHNSCRPKLIAPSELAEASVGRNAAYAEAVRTGRRRKKRAPEPAILRARSQIANGPKNDECSGGRQGALAISIWLCRLCWAATAHPWCNRLRFSNISRRNIRNHH
jgi:hypothetical protein